MARQWIGPVPTIPRVNLDSSAFHLSGHQLTRSFSTCWTSFRTATRTRMEDSFNHINSAISAVAAKRNCLRSSRGVFPPLPSSNAIRDPNTSDFLKFFSLREIGQGLSRPADSVLNVGSRLAPDRLKSPVWVRRQTTAEPLPCGFQGLGTLVEPTGEEMPDVDHVGPDF